MYIHYIHCSNVPRNNCRELFESSDSGTPAHIFLSSLDASTASVGTVTKVTGEDMYMYIPDSGGRGGGPASA